MNHIKSILLTPREHEVLRLVALGEPNKAIGSKLGCCQQTAEHHKQSLMNKTGLHCAAGLTRLAVGLGLVEPIKAMVSISKTGRPRMTAVVAACLMLLCGGCAPIGGGNNFIEGGGVTKATPTKPDINPLHQAKAETLKPETLKSENSQAADALGTVTVQTHTFKLCYEANDFNNYGDECVIDIFQTPDFVNWTLEQTVPSDATNITVPLNGDQMFYRAQARSLTTGLKSGNL